MKDIDIKENPDIAVYKESNKVSLNNDKINKLKEKQEKLLKRTSYFPGICGAFTIGMISSTGEIPIALAGGAIVLGTGLLIAKTHDLILKRKINNLEKEDVKRK